MKTVEERARYLAETADPEWRGKIDERIRALPKHERTLAEGLFTVLSQRPILQRHRFRPFRDEFVALDTVSDESRSTIFAAFHPELAPALSTWWKWTLHTPYVIERNGSRYRSVGAGEFTFERRATELSAVVIGLGRFRRDIRWASQWAAYIPWSHDFSDRSVSDGIGAIVGAVASSNSRDGNELFDDLLKAMSNEPGTTLSSHVLQALLQSGRPQGIKSVTDLLCGDSLDGKTFELALQAVDLAPVSTFRTIARTVIDRDLRRSVSGHFHDRGWFTQRPGKMVSAELLDLVDDPTAAFGLVRAGDPDLIKLGLDAIATVDVEQALVEASVLSQSDRPERRLEAARFLALRPIQPSHEITLPLINDPDLDIALAAHVVGEQYGNDKANPVFGLDTDDYFQRSVKLMSRVAAEPEPAGRLRGVAHRTLKCAFGQPLDPFVPHLDALGTAARRLFASHAHTHPQVSDGVRGALVKMLSEHKGLGASSARFALRETGLSAEHIVELERLLKQKPVKLRQRCLELLGELDAERALASADRLWANRSRFQRDAACALLAVVDSTAIAERAACWLESATTDQRSILESLVGSGLGIAPTGGNPEPDIATPIAAPPEPASTRKQRPLVTPAAARLVVALDDLIHSQRDTEIEYEGHNGRAAAPLGEIWHLTDPVMVPKGLGSTWPEMVHGDFFRSWFDARPRSLRSLVGDDALRALCALRPMRMAGSRVHLAPADSLVGRDWTPVLGHEVGHVRNVGVLVHVLGWLAYETATAEGLDELIEVAVRQAHATTTSSKYADRHKFNPPGFTIASQLLKTRTDLATPERMQRVWALLRWSDLSRPSTSNEPRRARNDLCMAACDAGVIPSDEFEQLLIDGFGPLWHLTSRSPHLWSDHPNAMPATERATQQMIEAELTRGDAEAPTTRYIPRIRSMVGSARTLAVLARLGDRRIQRSEVQFPSALADTLSHLLKVSYPDPQDTGKRLRKRATELGIEEERLIELAMYTPRWASLIESAVDWPGLDSAIHWMHAHTKELAADDSDDALEAWFSPLSAYTDLAAEELLSGAIDVAWFRNAHTKLGADRWQTVQSYAKLTTSGTGHRRAQLFSDVLTGALSKSECEARIAEKRHQDTVRSYGLVPLPNGSKARQAAIGERYRFLCAFEAESKKSGPQRRISERKATETAIENLARNAGYANALRFRWKMELDQLGDLADGSLQFREADLEIRVLIDLDGSASIAVSRSGKPLKAIPAAAKKKPTVKTLIERRRGLNTQIARLRHSLENAMTRAESFEPKDISELQQHPLVGPAIRNIVFVDQRGICMRLVGAHYRSAANRIVKPKGSVRVAHPHDLAASDTSIAWQDWLYREQIRQPFHQVFREHYVPTTSDATELTSRLFAGHQIKPRQTHALLGARGWTFDHETRDFSRPFRSADTMAWLSFESGFDTYGFPAVDRIEFTGLRSRERTRLGAVDPIVFSEATRDLDLVVSIAHASSIAVEASESTIETRTALARALMRLLSIDSVDFDGRHAMITGERGRYRIDLGSGDVYEDGSGILFIYPERRQQDGPIFLPFVDEDPRTSEILAKILTFATDATISDQGVLRQLRPSR